MTIKVLEKTPGCLPEMIEKGEWIDLTTAEETSLKGPYSKALKRKTLKGEVIERYRDVEFASTLIPLGICMQLPEGYEAYIVPRSSTYKKWGIIQANHIGIVDSTYCGDNDEWKMSVIAMQKTSIPKGKKIAQFRILLSQKATLWQKIKWLFSSKIKFEKVDSLENPSRGGFGSTGE